MSTVALRGLRKVYSTGVVAVDALDLDVPDGEVMVLLGPTGCGKSTVLRLIAGLEPSTAGQVSIGGRPVDDLPARERGIAMVFQDFGLYPHLTVGENIEFPLVTHHVDEPARAERVREVAAMLGLGNLLHRRPEQLSGGQRQRVAMARAIVRHPQVFLLDEPMSNLDALTRESVRNDVLELIHALGVATVYVTHDQVEALCLGDRIAVMRQGRIEQIGTPAEIYADPHRIFVAAFVGNPRMNLLQAAIYAERGERTVVDLGAQTLSLPWPDPKARVLAEHHTARVTVGLRPDALTVVGPDGAEDGARLHGTVRLVENRGHDALVHLDTGASPTPIELSHLELPDSPGELAHILGARSRRNEPELRYGMRPSYEPGLGGGPREALGDLVIRVPAGALPRAGDTLTLRVDLEQLYVFDRAGHRIRLTEEAGRSRPDVSELAPTVPSGQ